VPQGRASITYVPGRWVALAADDVWLLAELDPSGAILAACWEAVERGAGVDGLLGVILREGLRSVPSFALVGRAETELRLLVSGKAQAEVAQAGRPDPVTISAAGAPTWIEQRMQGNPDVRLVADGSAVTGETLALPLSGGIVLASAVFVGTLTTVAMSASPSSPPSPPPSSGPRHIAVAAPSSPPPLPVEPALVIAAPPPAQVADPPPARFEPAPPIPEPASPSLIFDQLTGNAFGPAEAAASPPPLPPPLAPPIPPAFPPGAGPNSETLYPRPQDETGLIDSLPWRRPEAFQPDDEPPTMVGLHSLPAPPSAPPGPGVPLPPAPAVPLEPMSPWLPPPAPAESPGFLPPPELPMMDAVQYTVERSSLLPGQDVPVVHAVSCPSQHLNPPYAGICRICGAPIPQQDAFLAPRPTLGVLTLSTGDTVPLDRDVVLGRAPFHADKNAQSRPHLVRLASPGNDISRSHVRISLEGWHVQVTDLGSTNGTVVTLPGQAPVRLRAHDPFTIIAGTTVNIADEVHIRFEVPS
jgi:hypothetical protein